MSLVLIAAVLAQAQAPAPAEQAQPLVRLSTPRDAVLVAAADLADQEPAAAVVMRYVWVQDPDWWRAVSLALNSAASSVGSMALPKPLAGGFVLRVDLRLYARDQAALRELIDDWERLADEPYFTEVVEVFDVEKVIFAPRYTWEGKEYTTVKARALRVPARHAGGLLGKAGYEPLMKAINGGAEPPNGCGPLELLWYHAASRAPIVEGRRLVARLLSQVNLGFGEPLYYEFLNFDRNPNRTNKKSDLDVILEERGASRFRGFRASVVDHSGVTEKKRRVIFIRQTEVLVGNGHAVVFITEDPSNKQQGFENDPFRNALGFRHTAKEVLLEAPNGLLVSLLTNEQGELQDAAPPDVVSDRMAPGHATTELHAGVAVCLRCHVLEEGRGFRKLGNDLYALRQAGLKVLDDVSQSKAFEAQNKIAEAYDWQPEDETLPAARRALEQAVFRATGGLSIEEGIASLIAPYNAYIYGRVSPAEALASLGIEVAEGDAARKFRKVLGLPELKVVNGRLSLAFVPGIDPTIARLAVAEWNADTKTFNNDASRWQWEAIYAAVAIEVQTKGVKP